VTKPAATSTAKTLPDASVGDLVAVINELHRICTLDHGTLVGAEATRWARWATNIADVKAKVQAQTGIAIDVLSPEQEGVYGYVTATRDGPERLSLDPGSNSFQIGWLPKGASAARTISVPFGYVLAAGEFYPAALRSAKVRGIYGEKALANAVLLDLLIKELGLETIVLVPQEMPAGYILAKI
jgi:exopolyphosphatase/pppGpp-phosphohydrolase